MQARRSTGGRVTRADTIHLTLAFLGDTGAARAEAAIAAARRVRATRTALAIEQAAYWKHNRIVCVGPRETDPSLADALCAELRAEGFMIEARPFKAHVTLLRKAGPGPLPELPPIDWPVRSFVLVRSELSAKGSAYRVVQEFALV
jgi:2'-5' RNA ligase